MENNQWKVLIHRQVLQAAKTSTLLKDQLGRTIGLLQKDPFQNPPQYEKLIGALDGCYARRISWNHWAVYQVNVNQRVVKVLACA